MRSEVVSDVKMVSFEAQLCSSFAPQLRLSRVVSDAKRLLPRHNFDVSERREAMKMSYLIMPKRLVE